MLEKHERLLRGTTVTDLMEPIVLLLINDDEFVRTALSVALSSFGLIVLTAANGQAALEFARRRAWSSPIFQCR